MCPRPPAPCAGGPTAMTHHRLDQQVAGRWATAKREGGPVLPTYGRYGRQPPPQPVLIARRRGANPRRERTTPVMAAECAPCRATRRALAPDPRPSRRTRRLRRALLPRRRLVKGGLDTHDGQAWMLRDVTERPVVSVHNRLAPEHRFRAPTRMPSTPSSRCGLARLDPLAPTVLVGAVLGSSWTRCAPTPACSGSGCL
jgi:hypothetical protein